MIRQVWLSGMETPGSDRKAKGRLKALAEKTNDGEDLKGHLRYRAHQMGDSWRAFETNAHPHCSDDGNVVGVHNGIIENYQELRDKLVKKDIPFILQPIRRSL